MISEQIVSETASSSIYRQFVCWTAEHRVLAFILGTALIQLFVVVSAGYIHSTSAAYLSGANNLMSRRSLDALTQNEQAASFNDRKEIGGETQVSTQPGELLENQKFASFDEQSSQRDTTMDASPNDKIAPSSELHLKMFQHKVESGETLSKIFKAYGAPFIGSVKAHEALQNSGVARYHLKVGETLELEINKGVTPPEITTIRKSIGSGKILELNGDSSSGYTSQIIIPPTASSDRVVVGAIKSSFSLAAADLSVPYEVADQLVDLFGSRVEFRKEIHSGDEFSIIYTEKLIGKEGGSQILEPGPILAASLKTNGTMMVAIRHEGSDGTARYFDERGRALERFYLRYPVQFSRISSVFSGGRFHPVLKVSRPHNGVDFAAPMGTPVRAVSDGKIIFAGRNGGSGIMVKIQHDPRYATAYLHLSGLAKGISKNKTVSRGEVIGTVGATGLATGPHLHFSFYDNGRYVDPLKVELPTQPVRKEDMISRGYLLAALKTLNHYHRTQNLLARLDIEPSA